MNFEIDELQKIAQILDDFMRDYGNSTALDVAADAIATEMEDRDTTVTSVLVTAKYLVDVKHKRSAEEDDVFRAAKEYLISDYHRLMDVETEIHDVGIFGIPDIEIDS